MVSVERMGHLTDHCGAEKNGNKVKHSYARRNDCTCCNFAATALGCLDKSLKDCGSQTWDWAPEIAGQLNKKKENN